MKKIIVVLKHANLEVYAVEEGQKTAKAETSWDPESLPSKLSLIKDKFGTDTIRVLLGQELGDLDDNDEILDVLADSATKVSLTIEAVSPASQFAGQEDIVTAFAALEEPAPTPDLSGPSTTIDRPLAESASPVAKSRLTPTTLKIILGIAILLLVAIIVGGVLRAKNSPKSTVPTPTPVASPTPTPIPIATATPAPVDLTELSVQVLNGSGIAGQAGVVKDLLVEAGFDADNIKTGNADNYDYTKTIVSLNSSVPDSVYTTIRTELVDYQVSQGDPLTTTSDYDIVITVGVTN